MSEQSTIHDLKIWPEHFGALISGFKPFELRFDDRGYRVGDTLLLREWAPGGSGYTGRSVQRRVTCLLAAADGPWLRPGFVVMGLANE